MPRAYILVSVDGGPFVHAYNNEVVCNPGAVLDFDNDPSGGESTFGWTIFDQPKIPVGAPTDNLTNPFIQTPQITVQKEGTYHFRLDVNGGDPLPDDAAYGGLSLTDQCVIRVLCQRTLTCPPAAGEREEMNALGGGWARRRNTDLDYIDKTLDSGATDTLMNVSGAPRGVGVAVFVTGASTYNTGLSSEYPCQTFALADAINPATLGAVGVVWKDTAGNPAIATGALGKVRFTGAIPFNTLGLVLGQPMYVQDGGGLIGPLPGTIPRIVGFVSTPGLASGEVYIMSGGGGGGSAGAGGGTPQFHLNGDLSVFLPAPFSVEFDGQWVAPSGGVLDGLWVVLKIRGNAADTRFNLWKRPFSGAPDVIVNVGGPIIYPLASGTLPMFFNTFNVEANYVAGDTYFIELVACDTPIASSPTDLTVELIPSGAGGVGAGGEKYNELPTQLAPTNFQTLLSFVPGTLRVFKNGMRQATPADYSETGPNTFSLVLPVVTPVPDTIVVDYTKV